MHPTVTTQDKVYTTPLFLPVFEHGNPFITSQSLQQEFGITGLITNAYLLYKKRALKAMVLEQGVKRFLDFNGLVVTDSGAFQQFSGPLYLSNTKIIAFQEAIGADVISPLDIITTPGDNRTSATKKLKATLKRVKAGLPLVERGILAGVQQGGRFLDLRGEALEHLVEMKVKYIALGSLVPFFTRNHHIEFICKVIKQAREIVPPEIPLHLYGSGDPLELPFYMALGCNIFDSSAFIHYAKDDWYMTPYGALKGQARLEATQYKCSCPYCKADESELWQDKSILTAHNLWTTQNVMAKATRMVEDNTIFSYLAHVIQTHQQWFPESRLAHSWQAIRS